MSELQYQQKKRLKIENKLKFKYFGKMGSICIETVRKIAINRTYLFVFLTQKKISLRNRHHIFNLNKNFYNQQIVLNQYEFIICLTLQKILSSNIISNTNKVEIQILSDSGFQHKISNRMVKNNVINLFGEKIFLPKTTNFILFEVSGIDQNKTRSRICAFSYQIDQVPIINKKRTIVGLDQNFNDFSLQFCIRMSLEVDTDTIHYTQQEFSEINPLQNLGKVGRNIIIPHKKDDNSKKSKIYSPKNQGSKKLIVDEMQNWDIKSEFSPSKNRFHLTNQMEEQYQLFQKQHTNESQSTQSQSIHERFQHNMKNGFGIDEHLEEYIEEKRTVKDCQLKLKENQAHKWQQLLKYKQFFLLGGMVGLLSAIFSTQLLLL